uniref:Ribonuclease 4 n=1 Tax=Phocoena sinus TaxID=42100 RepID=A0A8C9C096_PHOSS
MALQTTHALLLLLLLTLLGLGLVQPSYGQDRMYQRFLRQHVDPDVTGGNDGYCNLVMQRRKMTSHQCKRFNTFIHEDLGSIHSICRTSNIQCKNGRMNCHEGVVKVTDCRETGSSRAPNCRYRAKASTRRVVIACEGLRTLPLPHAGSLAHLGEEQQTKASEPGTNYCCCSQREPQRGDLKRWGQVFWDAFLSSYCCWDYGGQCVHSVLCLSISPRLTGLKFSIYSQGFSSATRQ